MKKIKITILVISLSFLSYLSLNGFSSFNNSPANKTKSGTSKKITDNYVCKDKSIIIIEGYFITKNSSRILKAVKNSLEYLEENAGKFPCRTFKIIETPKSISKEEGFFPGGFNICSEHINPSKVHSIERKCAYNVSIQYFENLDEPDWIKKGLASFLSDKIVNKFYGAENEHFIVSDYYPVYGYNLLSYHNIPLIYTIGSYRINEGEIFLKDYYKRIKYGAISDSASAYPDNLTFEVNKKNKPAILFYTLENLKGKEFIKNAVKKILNDKGNFFDNLKRDLGADSTLFIENFITQNKVFDYAVSGIWEKDSKNYVLLLERLGDGILPQQVNVFTKNDTLSFFWNGIEKVKLLRIKSSGRIIAAQIDPAYTNLFDINIANNSYKSQADYSATVSLSVRWFFWIQNLLMTSGSAG